MEEESSLRNGVLIKKNYISTEAAYSLWPVAVKKTRTMDSKNSKSLLPQLNCAQSIELVPIRMPDLRNKN
jgi:hypothetical protein